MSTPIENKYHNSGSVLNCFVNWIARKTMTKTQRVWLDRLGMKDKWKLDRDSPFDDAIVALDGSSTYLNENAIVIRDKYNNKKCCFSVDWFGVREKTCKDLANYLYR